MRALILCVWVAALMVFGQCAEQQTEHTPPSEGFHEMEKPGMDTLNREPIKMNCGHYH